MKKLWQRKVSQPKLKEKLFPECVMKHYSVMIKARKLKKLHHLEKASHRNIKSNSLKH